MCTSITLPLPDGTQLFGRTLDWHEHFNERMIHVPQGFSFDSRPKGRAETFGACRYAILGMGTEAEGYPLFADAMNEHGLCMAGLRFAELAHYLPVHATPPAEIECLAPWELIPRILGFCAGLDEARKALSRVRVVDASFPLAAGGELPNAPLHWHIADCRGGTSLVVEATARGLSIYDAPLGVMSNAPDYPEQLAAYETIERTGVFLPAGYDSAARFVRAAHLRRMTAQTIAADPYAHADAVADFFAMTEQLTPPTGAVPAVSGEGWQTTVYTCCMDGARGRYLYTTAEHPARREVILERG